METYDHGMTSLSQSTASHPYSSSRARPHQPSESSRSILSAQGPETPFAAEHQRPHWSPAGHAENQRIGREPVVGLRAPKLGSSPGPSTRDFLPVSGRSPQIEPNRLPSPQPQHPRESRFPSSPDIASSNRSAQHHRIPKSPVGARREQSWADEWPSSIGSYSGMPPSMQAPSLGAMGGPSSPKPGGGRVEFHSPPASFAPRLEALGRSVPSGNNKDKEEQSDPFSLGMSSASTASVAPTGARHVAKESLASQLHNAERRQRAVRKRIAEVRGLIGQSLRCLDDNLPSEQINKRRF